MSLARLTIALPFLCLGSTAAAQSIIDERANAAQRDALLKIMTGQETDDMATMWWVYSAMSPTKLETLYKPIDFEVDVEKRTGHMSIPGVAEMSERTR